MVDGAGLNYINNLGQFNYPTVDPGTYRIEVVPPEGFNFASIVPENDLLELGAQEGLLLPRHL